MPEPWLRESPRKRRQLAAAAVYDLLPADGSEIGWSELKAHAEGMRMSSATLRIHLRKAEKLGFVYRRADPSTYPPHVYYRRLKYLHVVKPIDDSEEDLRAALESPDHSDEEKARLLQDCVCGSLKGLSDTICEFYMDSLERGDRKAAYEYWEGALDLIVLRILRHNMDLLWDYRRLVQVEESKRDAPPGLEPGEGE